MPLRIGFDMDGVLADFSSAFHEVEVRLFGRGRPIRPELPEEAEERGSGGQALAAGSIDDAGRRSEAVSRGTCTPPAPPP